MNDAELRSALREHAYLEGDFVLRSGRRSRYYLDKYRFETRPDLLRPIGRAPRRGDPRARARREADRRPGAGRGRARGGRVARVGPPVPDRPQGGQGLRDRQPPRGVYAEGDRVCVVEDVVTSGGAAVEAVKALREAGLECSTAICVVDREEGGVDALARHAVRLWPIFRASEVLETDKTAAKPHG